MLLSLDNISENSQKLIYQKSLFSPKCLLKQPKAMHRACRDVIKCQRDCWGIFKWLMSKIFFSPILNIQNICSLKRYFLNWSSHSIFYCVWFSWKRWLVFEQHLFIIFHLDIFNDVLSLSWKGWVRSKNDDGVLTELII